MCQHCTSKAATARELTRAGAESLLKKMAADFKGVRSSLTDAQAEELAMASILAKRPKLIVTCDGCGHEWVE
jgi:hypothetical protein